MKQNNLIKINGKYFTLGFDFADRGDSFVKWDNFYADCTDNSEFFELQITKEHNSSATFSIEKFNVIEGCDDDNKEYNGEWYNLDDFIKDKQELFCIKEMLIKLSDQL